MKGLETFSRKIRERRTAQRIEKHRGILTQEAQKIFLKTEGSNETKKKGWKGRLKMEMGDEAKTQNVNPRKDKDIDPSRI